MKTLLALTSFAAVGFASTAAVTPASAGQANCWFQQVAGGRLNGAYCRVSDRVNTNGHVVHDVVESNGTRRAVVLWNNSTAEVFLRGKRHVGSWQIDSDNDVRVSLTNGTFAFRPSTPPAVTAPPSGVRPQAPAGPAPDMSETPFYW